jgi:hypothetical protein
MASTKSLRVLVIMGMLLACMLSVALPSGAEELHYKFYTWSPKGERVPVGDVAGHEFGFMIREAFLVFENGQIATSKSVGTIDFVNGDGPFMQYQTITFPDQSIIVIKNQGTSVGVGSQWTSEILKGTGRFEGIKGTISAKGTYLRREPGEGGGKGYGEGTITYTLPGK